MYNKHMNVPTKILNTIGIIFYYIRPHEPLINAYSQEQDTFVLLSLFLSIYNNTAVKQSYHVKLVFSFSIQFCVNKKNPHMPVVDSPSPRKNKNKTFRQNTLKPVLTSIVEKLSLN